MDTDFYTTLIQKELLEGISPEEAQQLLEWRQKDSENEAFYRDVVDAWAASDEYGADIEVDLDQDFKAVQSKIKPDKIRPMFVKWAIGLAAAAALALFVLNKYGPHKIDSQSIHYAFEQAGEYSLPDGSLILGEKGSKLVIPTDYGHRSREIDFDGSAYFSVKSDQTKAFKVNGARLKVEVLGTTFLLDDRQGESRARVDLLEGKLKVSSDLDEQTLSAGQSTMLNPKTQKLEHSRQMALQQYPWFGEQPLSFKKEPLDKVLAVVGNLTGQEIQNSSSLQHCEFSGKLPGRDAKKMLSLIAKVFGASLVEQDARLSLKEGTCQ